MPMSSFSKMEKDSFVCWVYVAATSVAAFIIMGFFDCNGIFLAIFIDHFNESNSKAAWVGSVMFFLEQLLCPVVVYLHRTIGFSWCMVIASAFYVLSCLTTPFMPNLNLIFLTMAILAGIPYSFIGILSITTQREFFFKYYSLSIGLRFLFAAIGGTVFSIVLPVLFDCFGWKKAFWSMIAFTPVFLLYAFAYRLATRDTKQGSSKVTKANSPALTIKNIYLALLQDKVLVVCILSSTLFHFVVLTPSTFMVQYGIRLGHPLSTAKWLLTVKNICTIAARLLAGHIAGIAFRHGKIKLLMQVIEFLFGLASLLCSFTRSFPLLLLYMGFCGALEGIFFVVVPLLVHEITAGYNTDDAFALLTIAVAFSLLLGFPTAGWIYDMTDDFGYVLYLAFFTSIIAAFLLTVSSWLTVTKSYVLVEGNKQAIILTKNYPEIIFTKREDFLEKFSNSRETAL